MAVAIPTHPTSEFKKAAIAAGLELSAVDYLTPNDLQVLQGFAYLKGESILRFYYSLSYDIKALTARLFPSTEASVEAAVAPEVTKVEPVAVEEPIPAVEPVVTEPEPTPDPEPEQPAVQPPTDSRDGDRDPVTAP